MKRDQPSSAPRSARAKARRDQVWVEQRVREIDAANAERARHLSPTPKYGWEDARDRRRELEARVAGLERALATAERKVARQEAVIRGLRRSKGAQLETFILDAIDHSTPRMPAEILTTLEHTYGRVHMRELMRRLADLKADEVIRRVPAGYIKVTA